MAESGQLAHSPTLVSTPVDGPERLDTGSTVGEFLVEGFLGAGAMGEVYAGLHPVIGKKVAIKILKREVAASPDGAERFKREARAVNQIDHPNVIDIFSFGRLDDGRLYLVMDLVEGRSLRKALVDGPIDVETALDVLAEIADALDAAHARGVVHRDLKPDNVMLGSGTPPKVFVLDFGLAKMITAADANAPVSMLTGQGTWLGTPGYMAPEQWSADGAGPASDRYALGVMAFELLSGHLPFQAASLPQMMEQHFRAKVPALSTRGAIAAHSTFDPVITRAMAKNPDERFATGREMVEALRTAAGKPGRTGRVASAPPRRAWIPAAAGAGVLGLAFAAVMMTRNTGEPTEPTPVRPALASTPAIDGKVRMTIESAPPGADIYTGDRLIGKTPGVLEEAPQTAVTLSLRMPGYLPLSEQITIPDAPGSRMFTLVAINGFEGVWSLPSNAELRGFKRVSRSDGEQVEVSKLKSVDGEWQFYRHYKFVPATSGVTFSTTEIVIDPAAPSEPTCHIEQDVEYHYEPATDALTIRQQKVRHDLVHGKCVIKSKVFLEPAALARVDRASSTERETIAPAGKFSKPTKPVNVKKAPPPPNGQGKGKEKTSAVEQLQKQSNLGTLPAVEPTSVPNQVSAPRGDSQVAPQQAAPQQVAPNAPPQQAAPQPPQQQIAPQVKQKK